MASIWPAMRTESSTTEMGYDANLYYENAASHLSALNDMFLAVLKAQ